MADAGKPACQIMSTRALLTLTRGCSPWRLQPASAAPGCTAWPLACRRGRWRRSRRAARK